jgi:hypothetical protein
LNKSFFKIIVILFVIIVFIGAGIRYTFPENSNFNYLDVQIESKSFTYRVTNNSSSTIHLNILVSIIGNTHPYNLSLLPANPSSLIVVNTIDLIFISNLTNPSSISNDTSFMSNFSYFGQLEKYICPVNLTICPTFLSSKFISFNNNNSSACISSFSLSRSQSHLHYGAYAILLGGFSMFGKYKDIISKVSYINQIIVIKP